MLNASFHDLQWSDKIRILSSAEGLFRYLDALGDTGALPSLILLDYYMPGAGAEDILLRLKSKEAYAGIRVAVYSTEMSETLCLRLKALGAADCYIKQWDTNGNRQLAEILQATAIQAVA